MSTTAPPTQRTEPSLEELVAAIEASFAADTAADGENWCAANPSYGHCTVASLIVQDHFGGELLRGVVNGVSHYWNLLPSGEEIDLTREQFGEILSETAPEPRTRDYALSFAPTAHRYALLAARVRAVLGY